MEHSLVGWFRIHASASSPLRRTNPNMSNVEFLLRVLSCSLLGFSYKIDLFNYLADNGVNLL